MSENRGGWGAEGIWWPNADQQQLIHQMQNQNNQQNVETSISSSNPSPHNQMFTYKMASTFENTNTSNSTHAADNQNSMYNSGIADYSQHGQIQGGGHGQQQQGGWWGYQQGQDMHNTGLQGLQNMSNQQQQSMQNPGVRKGSKMSIYRRSLCSLPNMCMSQKYRKILIISLQ